MRNTSLHSLVAVWLLACGGANDQLPDTLIDPPDAPVAMREVTGTMRIRHVTLTGETIEPVDLTSFTIRALVMETPPTPVKPPRFGSFRGVGAADGTFSIAGVPEGTFYLQLNDRYIVTSRSSIDFGADTLGRADRLVATNPTPLTFNVAALQPWQTDDELQMFSPGNGLIAFAMQTNATAGVPAVGATSLSGFTFDLSRADFRPLIDGTAGDLVTLTQLGTQSIAGRSFRAVTRSFEPTAFTIANGGSATVSGTFVVPAANPTLDVIWDRPAFDADIRARSPGNEPINYSILGASVLPDAATRGSYHSAPDLVVFEPGFIADATSVTAVWPYRDPYPVTWTRTLTARYFTHRFIQLGAATPLAVFSSISVDHDRGTLLPQSIVRPLIGAVVDPKVNGNDAFGSLVGIGTTPTVSWSPPTIGVASRYYVTVQRVMNVAGATELVGVAFLDTSDTSVVVPPGVLDSGGSYVFTIASRASPGLDPEATPLRSSLPDGLADLTTAVATP